MVTERRKKKERQKRRRSTVTGKSENRMRSQKEVVKKNQISTEGVRGWKGKLKKGLCKKKRLSFNSMDSRP